LHSSACANLEVDASVSPGNDAINATTENTNILMGVVSRTIMVGVLLDDDC
jgi:hypothetical protein